jgi:hypothetical protein
MVAHIVHLLNRSLALLPTSLGSNWLGLLFPLLVFLLTQCVSVFVHGWSSIKVHWKGNLLVGFAVALLSWSALFLWCVARIIYQDHMTLATRVSELNQTLTNRSHGCWISNVGMKPPVYLPSGTHSGNIVVFWCAMDVEAPLSIEWQFTSPPVKIGVPMFPDVIAINAEVFFQVSNAVAYIERPSLLKFQPTVLEIFGTDTRIAPQVAKVVLTQTPKSGKPITTIINATDLR